MSCDLSRGRHGRPRLDTVLLKIDALATAAFYHKEKKVVKFAVGEAVVIDDLGRNMPKVRRDQTDGKFVILRIATE